MLDGLLARWAILFFEFPQNVAGTHTALVRIEHRPGLPTPHGGAST